MYIQYINMYVYQYHKNVFIVFRICAKIIHSFQGSFLAVSVPILFFPKRFLSWGVHTLFVDARGRQYSSAGLYRQLLGPPGGWILTLSFAEDVGSHSEWIVFPQQLLLVFSQPPPFFSSKAIIGRF